MNEWLQILSMSLGGVLFAAGGTDIPRIGGQKWLRRFLLAALFGGLIYINDIAWWRAVGVAVGLCIAFHQPYGHKHSYYIKIITAVGFTIPTLFIGFNLWQLFTPLAFISMFWLSNNKYTSSLFPWKVVEFLTGVYIAITVNQLIGQTY